MKIETNKIPPEGLVLTEQASSGELDLNTDNIKFKSPVAIKALVSRITNALTVNLELSATMSITCSRCLGEFETEYKQLLRLNYPIDKPAATIDLNPEIREEIILNYPLKTLCKEDCKGLCPKCGQNLNQGGCCCATTKTKTL